MANQPAIVVESRDDNAYARVSGKLDHEVLERLGREATGSAPLILSLAAVTYVSSSGLAGLAKLSSRRDLRLVALPRMVRDTIGLAGLDRILRIFEDEQAAAAAPGGVL